jgi:hypothetical protein
MLFQWVGEDLSPARFELTAPRLGICKPIALIVNIIIVIQLLRQYRCRDSGISKQPGKQPSRKPPSPRYAGANFRAPRCAFIGSRTSHYAPGCATWKGSSCPCGRCLPLSRPFCAGCPHRPSKPANRAPTGRGEGVFQQVQGRRSA